MPAQRSFSNAVKWAYTGNLGEKFGSALFTFILAGVLGPRDFGTVSIAVIFITFLQMFLDQGLATALIQRKDVEQQHLDAVFWMDVVLAAGLVAITVAFSKRWATLNHSPQIAYILPVLSFSIVLEALSVVQTALLRRHLDFRSLSLRTNISVLVSGCVGVSLAFAGFRVWALVIQQLVRDLIALVLLWRLSEWRPRLEFSFRHLKELMGFSVPNFIAQLGLFLGGQADSLTLGVLFGPVAVGLYRVADRVINSLLTASMASIQAVSLSEFSRCQGESERLRRSVLTCIRLTATTTLPLLAIVISIAPTLMAVLGHSWSSAANVVRILGALGMFLVFSFFTGPVLLALGRPRLHAALEWSRTILTTGLLVAVGIWVRRGSPSLQIAGIAGARFIAGACIVTPLYVYILLKLSGVSLRELIGVIRSPVFAALGAFASVFLLQFSGFASHGRPALVLGIESIVGLIVGAILLLVLDEQLRTSLGRFLQNRREHPIASTHLV